MNPYIDHFIDTFIINVHTVNMNKTSVQGCRAGDNTLKSKEIKSNWEVWVAGHKLHVSNKTYFEAIEEAEAFGTPFAITQKNYTYYDREKAKDQNNNMRSKENA